jgi:hypothetical protein
MTNKSHAISVRLDADLHPTVKNWLKQHPGFSMSRLTNMAIRGFVSEDQVLEAVETVHASKKEVKTSLNKLMKKHKKTLDELK